MDKDLKQFLVEVKKILQDQKDFAVKMHEIELLTEREAYIELYNRILRATIEFDLGRLVEPEKFSDEINAQYKKNKNYLKIIKSKL